MMDAILLPKSPRIVSESGHEATIEIEGLHPGYGITLGNALKRVLHSSLPGAAVTHVRIEGAKHEFSTIDGVLEDVLAILLNLKQVRFKLHTEGPQTVTIDIKGERVILASDIKCPTNVEVINPDFHIATLTNAKATFQAELTIEAGVGYIPREMLSKDKVAIGTIGLDAIFTPVRKVRYDIENMRVGTSTNYNKLIFTIQTDGSIAPSEAFTKAVSILTAQLKQLEHINTEVDIIDAPVAEDVRREFLEEAKSVSQEASDAMSTPIEDLKLSSRTINALSKAGVATIGDLLKYTHEDLLEFDGFGEKALTEVQRAIGTLGFTIEHRN
ncbi:MAG: DNA-directed RNA polymerase subunit alpha [Patescibacteria group bacterium]